jgi:hypothetical protein
VTLAGVVAEFRPHPSAVFAARGFLRSALSDLGLIETSGDLIDLLVMAANELATNAVLHAAPNSASGCSPTRPECGGWPGKEKRQASGEMRARSSLRVFGGAGGLRCSTVKQVRKGPRPRPKGRSGGLRWGDA